MTFVNLSCCGSFSEDAYLSRLPVSIIQSWYQREGYIKAMADLIGEELKKFPKPEEVCFTVAWVYFIYFCYARLHIFEILSSVHYL